jgi:hypothetical protein
VVAFFLAVVPLDFGAAFFAVVRLGADLVVLFFLVAAFLSVVFFVVLFLVALAVAINFSR